MLTVSARVRARNCASATLILLAALSLSDSADARNRLRDKGDDQPAQQQALSGRPVVAVVSIKDQRISVYDSNGEALRAPVSTGQTDYETPVGVYTVLEKQEEHYSNIYDDASMPFMQRITWSGIALHAGALPGYPASHGCVRLPHDFAQQLFPLTRLGLRVVVAHDDAAPSDISHSLLPKPLPAGEAAVAVPATFEDDVTGQQDLNVFEPDVSKWPARAAQLQALKVVASEKNLLAQTAISQADELKAVVDSKKAIHAKALKQLKRAEASKKAADEKVDRADRALLAAKKPSQVKRAEDRKAKAAAVAKVANDKFDEVKVRVDAAEKELSAATAEWTKLDEVKKTAVAAQLAAKWKTYPISMFISRKTQRLYVRRANEAVFDAPITISNPDEPIGTHVLTAVDYKDQGKDLRWQVVTIARRSAEDTDRGSYKKRRRVADLNFSAPQTDSDQASAALDRITIPPDVAEQISGYVWPGSSLIVSDEPLSKETGKATDFIVVISTEPQGSLKKRPRRTAPSYVRDDPYYDYYDGSGRYSRYDRYDRYDRRYYRNKPTFFNWW
jgi:hypothetical protein